MNSKEEMRFEKQNDDVESENLEICRGDGLCLMF
jgi:hypothetical protein